MKRFAICREYLVPVFQYVTVDAENAEEACKLALDDLTYPWDGERYDHESAGPTFVGAIAEVEPEETDACPYDYPQTDIPPTYTRKFLNKGHWE